MTGKGDQDAAAGLHAHALFFRSHCPANAPCTQHTALPPPPPVFFFSASPPFFHPLQAYLCVLMQPPRRRRAGVHPFLVLPENVPVFWEVYEKRGVGFGASKVRNTKLASPVLPFHREQLLLAP